MSDPFIAQIVMFGGNFAPRGWALCDGQLLPIAQNTALFSILGTTYGGDGRTTFGLPDLRGRVPVHPGNGPGLSPYQLGQRGGTESVTLNTTQIPPHSHALSAKGNPANDTNPAGKALGRAAEDTYVSGGTPVPMDSASIGQAGGGQSHTNIQPYQTVNYIIALVGVFPSRN
jgi:microcystin-dependent protein